MRLTETEIDRRLGLLAEWRQETAINGNMEMVEAYSQHIDMLLRTKEWIRMLRERQQQSDVSDAGQDARMQLS